MSSQLDEHTHGLGLLSMLTTGVEEILHELRRGHDWAGAGEIKRVYWDPAAGDPSAGFDTTGEFDYSDFFESVGIFNLSPSPCRVAFTPKASARDTTTMFTLGGFGFAVLPYKGVTVSVSGDVAGSALIVAFDIPQPAQMGVLGADQLVWTGATTTDRVRTPTVFKPLSAVVVTSETTIWTPAAGKRFRLMGWALTQGVVTGAITLKDNTAGATILVIPPNTVGVPQTNPPLGNGYLSAAAGNVLTATGASTETLTGFVFGTEE